LPLLVLSRTVYRGPCLTCIFSPNELLQFFGGDPFEHFAAGGMPGMGGGRGAPRGDVDTEELYKTLGVEKDADESAIKKAYRKLALKVRQRARA
jgi:DnaJ-domain-containing protein 1